DLDAQEIDRDEQLLAVRRQGVVVQRWNAHGDASSISCIGQVPISPPSSLVIITVAERGRAPSGQFEIFVGACGSLRSEGDSPGCWMLMNIACMADASVITATSQPARP